LKAPSQVNGVVSQSILLKSGNNYTVNIRNLTLDDNVVIEGAALYYENGGASPGYYVAKTKVKIDVKGWDYNIVLRI